MWTRKSQIAIEHCYRFQESYPTSNVFWIHCSKAERIEQEYKEIARKLELPGWDDPKVNIGQMILDRLSDPKHGIWLMVLDNADDDDDTFFSSNLGLGGSQSQPLARYLPQSGPGFIVITTRDKRVGRRLANSEEPIMVDNFELKDALCLLQSKIGDYGSSMEEEARELFETVQFLPLAISQAAAFINENEISLATYVEMLRANESELTNLMNQGVPDHRRDLESSSSVMQTWKLSFDRIRTKYPRTGEVLSLMAVLDRQGILGWLLRTDDELESELLSALGTLKAYFMITTEKDREMYVLHRLVQVFTQEWLDVEGRGEHFQGVAVRLLSTKFPWPEYENWEWCELLLPHAQVASKYRLESKDYRLYRAKLLRLFSCYESARGQVGTAYEHAEMSYNERLCLLGEDNEHTMTSLSYLARYAIDLGKYEESERMAQQILTWRTKELGKEHQATISSVEDVASALEFLGRYQESEEMSRKALALRIKTKGKEHQMTLDAMNRLALSLGSQRKLEEAEGLLRHVIQRKHQMRSEDLRSEDHPSMSDSKSVLALVLSAHGKHEDAEQLQRETLLVERRIGGPKHPSTFTESLNLAYSLFKQSRLSEAIELFWNNLELQREVLPRAHPDILTTMIYLARVLNMRCEYEAAEQMYKEVLVLQQEALGKAHPGTLSTMFDISKTLFDQQKYEAARGNFQTTLQEQEKALGKTDIRTLETSFWLSMVLHDQERYEEAEEGFRSTLQEQEKALGETDTTTLNSSYWLSIVLYD